MSVQPNPQTEVDVEAGQVRGKGPGFGSTGERFMPLDGVGSLLFEMHSISHSVPWFVKSETQLQFYEHAVKAFVSKKLWCFPEMSKTVIIPRFKIVDCTFTLGPRIESFFWLAMLLSIVLLIIGAKAGGCNSSGTSTRRSTLSASDLLDFTPSFSSSYNDPSTSYNSGACASLVIGCLMLVICAIAFVLIFFFFKWNRVRLDTIAAKKQGNFARFDRGIRSYEFNFQKIGFKHSADDKASFDQFYLMDYVCKPFGKQSAEDMYEYHVFSHFNHAGLAAPIEYDVGRNHDHVSDMGHRNVKHRHHVNSTKSTKSLAKIYE